jgi:tripartite-type tricarboxylate transporter receptor subunit TctC
MKKILICGVAALAFAGLATSAAQAQSNVIRMEVAFPPGGPTDLVARVLAQQLSEDLKERVIVENRAGANGNIGTDYVAKAPADGTVLLFTTVGSVSISPSLYASLPYDPTRDFAPVSRVVNNSTLFVVNPTNPATDAVDFVNRSKAAKQSFPIGSSGVGSVPHLTLELFSSISHANVLHVPYSGAAPVINDVMGNQISGFMGDIPALIGFVRAGKLKPLGIAAPKRHPLLPDVKTMDEMGYKGVESNNWYAVVVPAKTPKPIIDKLNKAIRHALEQEGVRSKLLAMGAEPAPSTPEELAALIKSDAQKWGAIIKEKNIKAD